MTSVRQCARCHAELEEYSPFGVCPRCLLSSGFESVEGEPLDLSTRLFGDYELLEEIARGGMGIVYRAQQISLNRPVALKMILSGPFASAASVERFRAEAQAAANLQHPNIVAIHEVGEHDGLHYFTMDFVAGRNLAELLREGPLPDKRAATYLRQIAEAVHYAHQHGILHRDLKPSNTLIDESDRPRITDFGLAKRLSGDSELTLSGQVLGSPNFMPPEQASGKLHEVGTWSDVYSLGAILYQVVTGRPPFQAASVTDTLHAVLNTEPISPRLLNPAVPRDLDTICLKCLEKEPARRYRTPQEMADDLGRFLRGEPILARPIGSGGKAWRWCRRKPALAGALGAATVLFLVVAVGSLLLALHLQRQHQRAEEDLYASNIRLAQQKVVEDQLAPARELIQAIEATPRQRVMRGWEWRYLASQCQGDEVAQLPGHAAWIAAVEFSPDDKLLASISEDGEVRLWDWRAGKSVASWQAHERFDKAHGWTAQHSLAFSPDGATLVTGGADGEIHLWRVATQQRSFTLSGGGGAVTALCFSRDGRRLAAATISTNVSWWDLTGPEPALLAHVIAQNFPSAVAFLPDGNSVLVATARAIKRWDISEPGNPRELPSLLNSVALAISPDGQWLVAQARDADLFHLWRLPQMIPQGDLPARAPFANNPAISSDGEWLASGDRDSNITLLDLTRRRANIVLRGHENSIWSVAFAHHGELLASGGQDMTVRLWNLEARDQSSFIESQYAKIQDIKFFKDSKRFVTAGEELSTAGTNEHHYSTLRLWEIGRATSLAAATNFGHPLHQLASISANEQWVSCNDAISGNRRNADTLRLFSLPGLEPRTNWPGGPLLHSIEGSTIVYVERNRLLQRNSHENSPHLIGELPRSIIKLGLSSDGQTAVTACQPNNGALTFWDLSQRRPPVTLEHHQQGIHMLALSPDSRWLASGTWERTVGLWDIGARRWITGLKGHRAQVNCVAFSPDSQTLASGSSDATVRLWHVRTRRELAVLAAQVGEVWAVAFSPDNQWLLAGGSNGRVQQWRAPPWQEVARRKLNGW